jgi:hypothetical protein
MKVLNGLDLGSQRIQNLADPSTTTDAATKQYVDNLVQGLSWKTAVRAATTTNGTLASAFANGSVIDGVTLVTGNRILLKAQTAPAENGIYVVAASGAPTRATDADVAAELVNATVYVSEGTTLADTAYVCTTNAPITLGSTGLTWAQTGGGTTYTAGNGLTGSTTFAVLANGTSVDVSSSGVKIADAAGGNGLTVASGILAVGAGTGVTVAADTVGIDTSVVVRKYAVAIGNGALTAIAVTHNLGTFDITHSVQNATTHEIVWADPVATDANTLTLTFAVAPTSGQYRVTVHG